MNIKGFSFSAEPGSMDELLSFAWIDVNGFYRWFLLVFAFVAAFTLHLLFFSFSLLIPAVMTDLGLSHIQMSMVISICVFAIIIFRLVWGYISDLIGFSTAMKAALLITGIFSLLRGFSSSYEFLLLYQFLLGVGLGAIIPCLSNLVKNHFPEKSGLATGLYVSGFPFGEIASFILVPLLMDVYGDWRVILKFFGFWGLVVASLWFLLPVKTRGINGDKGEERGFEREAVIKLFRFKETWILAFSCIFTMGIYDTLCTWVPYILELRGFSPEVSGFITSMLPIGFLLSSPAIGFLSDKTGSRKNLVSILSLLSGPLTLSISLLQGFPLWTTTLLTGFCLTGAMTIIFVMPLDFPETRKLTGTALGFISSIGNIGTLLLPLIVGSILDATHSPLVTTLTLGLTVETIPLILSILKRRISTSTR